MAARPFKPHGTPPPFDLDEYKDSFELWSKKWQIFLTLSTIDSALEEDARPTYKAHTLLSCLSDSTLQAVLTMGLTEAQLDDHEVIIEKLRQRCNAERNRHVWRQQFASKKQGDGQAADDWLCELRDLSRKCEFAKDCCADCYKTRILGQIVFGVHDDSVRVKLLEKVTPSHSTMRLQSSAPPRPLACKQSTSSKANPSRSRGPSRRTRRLRGKHSSRKAAADSRSQPQRRRKRPATLNGQQAAGIVAHQPATHPQSVQRTARSARTADGRTTSPESARAQQSRRKEAKTSRAFTSRRPTRELQQ